MRRTILTTAAVVAAVLSLPGTASAAEETYVTPADVAPACSSEQTVPFCVFQRGTGTVEIGPGEPDAASGTDHLLIDTPDGNAKASLLSYEFAGRPLADIDTLGYRSFIDPASTAGEKQAPALNITIDPNGPEVAGGFATLVWEPVYADPGAIARGAWQQWTPSSSDGGWWSPANGTTTGPEGPLGFSTYQANWADVQGALPDATVLGVGVNQGGGNAGLVAQVDLLQVNDSVHDFETVLPYPTAKEQCKKGGWADFTAPEFRNQGQCVSWVARQSGDA
jgi:hypothetical protein